MNLNPEIIRRKGVERDKRAQVGELHRFIERCRLLEAELIARDRRIAELEAEVKRLLALARGPTYAAERPGI